MSNSNLQGIWLILSGINVIWFALRGISYSKHCHLAWYSLLEFSSSCKEASLLALLSFPNNFIFYSLLFFFLCLIYGVADIFCGHCGLTCVFLWHIWHSEFLWKQFCGKSFCLLAATKTVTCNSSFWTGLALLEILATSLLVDSMLTAMSTAFFRVKSATLNHILLWTEKLYHTLVYISKLHPVFT